MANPLQFLLDDYDRRHPEDQGAAFLTNPLIAREGEKIRALWRGQAPSPMRQLIEGFGEGMLRGEGEGEGLDAARGQSGSVMAPEAREPLRQGAFEAGKWFNVVPSPAMVTALPKIGLTLAAAPMGIVKKLSAAAQAKALRKAEEEAAASVSELRPSEQFAGPPQLKGPGGLQRNTAQGPVPYGQSPIESEFQAALQAEQAKKVRKGGKGKDPDALINLDLRSMSDADAIAAAQRGDHIQVRTNPKPDESGFKGAPRNIKTMDDIVANRDRMDATLQAAAEEQQRLLGSDYGTWYQRQREGVTDYAEPWQQSRAGRAEGLFSPQTNPEGELGHHVLAQQRTARDQPLGTAAKTGRQGREFTGSLKENREINLTGEKDSQFGTISDPTRAPNIYGTNDFRHANFIGYTEKSGGPQKSGMTSAQHTWMDAETLELVRRANEKKIGGRNDWNGGLVQEVAWINEKANSLQALHPKIYPGTPEGRLAALQEAAKTIKESIPKHTFNISYEGVPAVGGEPRPHWIGASGTQQGGRDILISAAQMYQRPTKPGASGVWLNPETGKTEMNSVMLARPMVEHANTRHGRDFNPATIKIMRAIEALRGLVDRQGAVAGHGVVRNPNVTSPTHFDGGEIKGNLSAQDMASINAVMPENWFAGASDQGAVVFPPKGAVGGKSKAAADTRMAHALINQKLKEAGLPPMDTVGVQAFYDPIYNTGKKRGPQMEEPGKGIVTEKALTKLRDIPEKVTTNLSEADSIRTHIKQVLKLSDNPPDVTKTLEFLRDADWGGIIDHARKHKKSIGAALAFFGYSLQGMAADDDLKKMLQEVPK